MPVVSMKQLLEAGIHFGHQTRRWNPKMAQYIYGQRNGIYIIDLQQTAAKLRQSNEFLKQLAAAGEVILFVGTKKQAQDVIEEEAKRCGMFFVNQRWLGGMLTNFVTIRKSVHRLKELERWEVEIFKKLPHEEVAKLTKEKNKLQKILGGVKEMTKLPAALFVIDAKKEHTAIMEARRMEIPIVGVVDTNSDPDMVDYIVPANDDAIRSIRLLTRLAADAVLEGRPVPIQPVADEGEVSPMADVVAKIEVEEKFEDMLSEEIGAVDVMKMRRQRKHVKGEPEDPLAIIL